MFILPRSSFGLTFLCVTFFSFLVWITSGHGGTSRSPGKARPHSADGVYTNVVVKESASDPIWEIQNRTLGFQKIYAVSMPHRTDKRDYLALMAHMSGLDIEFIDGVNGSMMHPHALPNPWGGDKGAGTYGCWRAHLDIYQKMLQEKIHSALIFEDDADWDVFLRAQLTDFARGTRYLTNATLPMLSPYGDDWDVLTIGHTGVDNKPGRDGSYWVTENDPTVIVESRRTWGRKPDLSVKALNGPHTRLVHTVRKMTGTASYAISMRGASRALYDQSMMPNAEPIDVALSNLCRQERWTKDFCIGSYPMLIGRYRAAGPRDKDSDRRAEANVAEPGSEHQSHSERLEPESEFTVFPVSLNIKRLMMGEMVIPANVPEKDLLKEIDLRTFVLPEGKPVFVRTKEYQLFNQQRNAPPQPKQEEKKAEEIAKSIVPRRHLAS
ncbi:hypothetical protein BCR34DRAFT_578395 [Clohesyomyces aquaticus]|uniref:Glycosyl transferase family 25 domain-containing protein n=1 Tax=Clohesyomyces aquaticus TaxID=1231657 RepID=A0A1Y1YFU1_9PLEO|nr:hypothetical protein BCR34DRAFT_578395 [Clohesyomyces aquaticus]